MLGYFHSGVHTQLLPCREQGVQAPPHPPPVPASQGPRGALTTEFSCAKMEETRFEDLWLRLGGGAPGLFCHAGGCEHLLVFRDVRAHDALADPPLKSQYPFRLSVPSMPLVHHRSCDVSETRWYCSAVLTVSLHWCQAVPAPTNTGCALHRN